MAGMAREDARERAYVPAIHVLPTAPKDVDARAGKFTQPAQAWLRRGHDE